MLLTRVFSLLPTWRAIALLCIFVAATSTAFAQPPGPADTIRSSNGFAICPGTTTQLSLNLPNGPANPNHRWESATALAGPWINIGSGATVNVSVAQWYRVSLIIGGVPTPYDTIQITHLPKPTPDFTFSPAGSCASVPVFFTNTTQGTGNTYTWSFGDPNSGGSNSSTATNPSHRFVGNPGNGSQNFPVKLVVTNSNGCKDSVIKTVNVLQSPGRQLLGNNAGTYQGRPFFRECVSAATADFTFINQSSTAGTNTNYRIIWGDGSTDYNAATFATAINHTYGVGVYTMRYIVTGGNGCTDTTDYGVFVGTNPAVGLGNPGNTTICTGSSLTFPISNTSQNPPGTIYTVTFDDGTPPITYTHPAPASITHLFSVTSCGNPFAATPNIFTATITASNPCDQSIATVVPIRVSDRPRPDITVAPSDTTCVNNITNIRATFGSGKYATSGGCQNGNIVWNIAPATGYTIVNGSLGNDNGQSNVALWTSGTDNLDIRFTTPGIYTIRIKLGNPVCGFKDTVKTICVNPIPDALMSLDQTEGCTPMVVNASSAAVQPICGSVGYNWTVSYTPVAGCVPTGSNYTLLNGTTLTSGAPRFQFNNPGRYRITLVTNYGNGACTSPPVFREVVVKAKPTATLAFSNPICQNQSITPTAIINACTSSNPASYAWSFPGGNPATSLLASPGNILYNTPGSYTVSLAVTNDCGTTTVSNPLTVSPAPDVTVPANVVVCAGQTVGPFNFSSTLAGTSFTWTNSNTNIGLAASGSGNIGSFTAINNGTNPVTATVTVMPVNSCPGQSKSFTITVNPRPLAPVVSNLNYCVGDAASPLTATALNGHTLNWYTIATGGTALGAAPTPTTSAPGTFTWWVSQTNSSTGCESPRASITVTVRMVPAITITSSNPATCGASTGSITINGLTPLTSYTVSYTRNGAPVSTNTSSDASGRIVLNLLNAAVYDQIRVATGGFCPSLPQGPISLSDPNPPAVPVAANNGPVCSGNNLNLTASSATAGVTYNWSGPAGFSSNQQNPVINNIQLNRAGTYSVTASLNGCVSAAASTTVVVNQTPVLTAAANSPVCENSTLQLNGTVTPAGSIVVWSGPNGFNATGLNASIANASLAANGTYTLTSALNGCPAIPATVNVLVRPTPVISNAVVAQPSSCTVADGSITLQGLTASISYQVNYTFNGTPQTRSLTANASGHVIINGLAPGNYTNIRVTLNGCVSNNANDVTLLAPNPPPTPVAANNGPVCTGSSLQLSATSTATGITYNWTGPNGFSSNLQNPIINNVTTNAAGTYTLTITQNGCVSAPATTTVAVNQTPVLSAVANSPVCENGTIQLTGTITPAGGAVAWTGPNAFNSSNLNASIANASLAAAGLYTLTGTLNGCAATPATVNVLVKPTPFINNTVATQPTSCTVADGSITLQGLTASTTYQVNYTFNSTPQSRSLTANASGHLIISGLAPGNYTGIRVTLNGCVSNNANDVTLVAPNPPPTPVAANNGPVCTGSNVQLTATSTATGITYNWTGPNGFSSNLQNPVLSNVTTNNAGTYSVTITQNGCVSAPATTTVDIQAAVSNNTIAANQSICINTTPAQLTGSTPAGGGGSIVYAWEMSTNGSSSWQTIAGANSINYQPAVLTQTTSYRRIVTTSLCAGPQSSYSNVITVTVNPNAVAVLNANQTLGCAPFILTPNNIAVQHVANRNGSYRWYVNNTLIGTGQTFPGYTISGSGQTVSIKVVAVSLFGCLPDSASVDISTFAGPTPSFTLSDTVGCGPLDITINNTTANSTAFTYRWDFGNGQTSTAAQPGTIRFAINPNRGDTIYTVTLKATAGCDTVVATQKIRVRARPRALFTPDKSIGCSPMTVTFNNNSAGSNASFVWDFGDGSPRISSNAPSLSHTFTTGVLDTFFVRLFASNDCGTDTATFAIVVNPNRIRLDMAVNGNELFGCVQHTVRFINNTTGANRFVWNFGDGSPILTSTKGFDTIVHVYTQPGTYTVTLDASNGCSDTSTTETITVVQGPTVSFTAMPAQICIGDSVTITNTSTESLAWAWSFGDGSSSSLRSPGKHLYTQAGTYRIVLRGTKIFPQGFGCTDSAVANIQVQAPTGSFQYRSGYYCQNQSIQLEVLNSNGNRFIFYPGNGDSIISNANTVTYRYPAPGRYLPSVKIFNGNCTIVLPGTDTVFVDRIIAGFRYSINQSCGSTTINFTDTSNVFLGRAQIGWRFGDGSTANTATVSKTFLQAGTYRVVMRITGISGCEDSAVQVIDVPVQPVPSIAIQGDSTACIGQAFTLQAVSNTLGNIQYNWNFGNNQQATGTTASTRYFTAGTATIRLIGRTDFGCADTVFKTIRINPSPVVVASNDAKICLGQTTTLQVRGANSYTWSPQQSLSCNDCSSTVASPTQTTAYVVTGSNTFGCSNTDTVLVTVVQPFQVSVSPNDTICFPQNESAQLFANGAKRYVWSPAVGLNATNIPNPVARPASTTAYTVIGYDDDNCFTDTAFVTVAVGYLPTLELGTGSMVVAGTAVTLNPIITNGPIKRYTWTPNKDLSCNNCPNPVATINNNILYRLNIENIYGCLATDTIGYTVQCKQNEQVYVPNAFSPDGDGVNDVLMVRGKGLSMVKSFIIFNRWGQVVFEAQNFAANDPTAGWNGIMKNTGKKAAQDVYVYRVETICTAGGTFTQTGNVTLFYMQ